MTLQEFDLVVLGTGPAGKSIAKAIRHRGHRVAIVEPNGFGGTCALRGCNPKKVYTNAGSLADQVRHAHGKLVRNGNLQIDWSDLHQFKEEFTTPVLDKTEQSLAEEGIETFHGEGRFTGNNRICVYDGLNPTASLQAKRIVIATGSRPRNLQFPGAELLTHSDEFLERQELPRRILFVGGGYISMEFACVVNQYGSETMVVDRGDRILKPFDPDLTTILSQWCVQNGIQLKTGWSISEIQQNERSEFVVVISKDGQEQSFVTDMVVHGAGRQANIDRLRLDEADVAFGDQGIQVDDHLQSVSNTSVFAAGDCADSGQLPLTPIANDEAEVVIENLFAETPQRVVRHDDTASVAFTSPPIASIGLSESQAREMIEHLDVNTRDVSTWGSIRKTGLPCGGFKILIDRGNNHVVGAHLLGPKADEQINLFALAMQNNLTVDQIRRTRFAYPTHGSEIRRMLGNGTSAGKK